MTPLDKCRDSILYQRTTSASGERKIVLESFLSKVWQVFCRFIEAGEVQSQSTKAKAPALPRKKKHYSATLEEPRLTQNYKFTVYTDGDVIAELSNILPH